jgi:hypothetical protein
MSRFWKVIYACYALHDTAENWSIITQNAVGVTGIVAPLASEYYDGSRALVKIVEDFKHHP